MMETKISLRYGLNMRIRAGSFHQVRYEHPHQ